MSIVTSSLPSPPFINVQGVLNFRDLGGYAITTPSGGSGSVRRNFIYRSGLPTKITPEGARTLIEDLHVRTIYDLRSNVETRKDPVSTLLSTSSPSNENNESGSPPVEIIHVPVFIETDMSPAQLAQRYAGYMSDTGTEGFVFAYSEMLTLGVDAYRRVFEHVRDRPQDAFLIHCTGGKDRTGVLAALLLGVAGVTDPDVISAEYALTEQGFDSAVRDFFMQTLLKDPSTKGNRAGVERLISAKKENMKATLDMIEEKYGGAEGYLKIWLRFSDDDIGKIKTNLRSKEKAIF